MTKKMILTWMPVGRTCRLTSEVPMDLAAVLSAAVQYGSPVTILYGNLSPCRISLQDMSPPGYVVCKKAGSGFSGGLHLCYYDDDGERVVHAALTSNMVRIRGTEAHDYKVLWQHPLWKHPSLKIFRRGDFFYVEIEYEDRALTYWPYQWSDAIQKNQNGSSRPARKPSSFVTSG